MSDSLWPHGLYSPRNSLGQNTGVGSLPLLQGIFPTQRLNPGLPHYRWILFQLSHKGSPRAPAIPVLHLPLEAARSMNITTHDMAGAPMMPDPPAPLPSRHSYRACKLGVQQTSPSFQCSKLQHKQHLQQQDTNKPRGISTDTRRTRWHLWPGSGRSKVPTVKYNQRQVPKSDIDATIKKTKPISVMNIEIKIFNKMPNWATYERDYIPSPRGLTSRMKVGSAYEKQSI